MITVTSAFKKNTRDECNVHVKAELKVGEKIQTDNRKSKWCFCQVVGRF